MHAEQACSAARSSGYPVDEAAALNALAASLDKAEPYARALRVAAACGARRPEIEALTGMASVLRRLGSPVQAARFAEHAIQLARDTGFRVAEGCALIALAEIRAWDWNPRTHDLFAQASRLGRETAHRGLTERAGRGLPRC